MLLFGFVSFVVLIDNLESGYLLLYTCIGLTHEARQNTTDFRVLQVENMRKNTAK